MCKLFEIIGLIYGVFHVTLWNVNKNILDISVADTK